MLKKLIERKKKTFEIFLMKIIREAFIEHERRIVAGIGLDAFEEYLVQARKAHLEPGFIYSISLLDLWAANTLEKRLLKHYGKQINGLEKQVAEYQKEIRKLKKK